MEDELKLQAKRNRTKSLPWDNTASFEVAQIFTKESKHVREKKNMFTTNMNII